LVCLSIAPIGAIHKGGCASSPTVREAAAEFVLLNGTQFVILTHAYSRLI
jgi:hypothetical protein